MCEAKPVTRIKAKRKSIDYFSGSWSLSLAEEAVCQIVVGANEIRDPDDYQEKVMQKVFRRIGENWMASYHCLHLLHINIVFC
jgi:hypothetical protein